MTHSSIMIATTGLALTLALATLPLIGYVCGGALPTTASLMLRKRVGRGKGFMAGAVAGILGALICALAIYRQNFWRLCVIAMLFLMAIGATRRWPDTRRGMARTA
ncbi:MAG TPA: hypothetical protein VK642_04295 [Burkholderiales bacterium]|nr:hypothetical protein [Burkholderiales bacterium]